MGRTIKVLLPFNNNVLLSLLDAVEPHWSGWEYHNSFRVLRETRGQSVNAYLCQVFALHFACWTRVTCVANFILAKGNTLAFLRIWIISPNSSSSFFYIDKSS